jgi:hypothetical protein
MNAAFSSVAGTIPTNRQKPAPEGCFSIMDRWDTDTAASRRLLGLATEQTLYEKTKNKAGWTPGALCQNI